MYIYNIYIHIVIRKKIVKPSVFQSDFTFLYPHFRACDTQQWWPRWGLWQESWLIELDVPEKTTAA